MQLSPSLFRAFGGRSLLGAADGKLEIRRGPSEALGLEEPQSFASDDGRAFVWQVGKFVDMESVGGIVGQNIGIGRLGLSYHGHGAWLIEKQIVDQAGPPRRGTMWSTVPCIANQRVSAAVVIARCWGKINSHVVLLNRVSFWSDQSVMGLDVFTFAQ